MKTTGNYTSTVNQTSEAMWQVSVIIMSHLSQWCHICVTTMSHQCHNDITPAWHNSACIDSTVSFTTEQKSGNDRFLFHPRNSLKWKTKLTAASSPISKSISETTALDVSEIQRRAAGTVMSCQSNAQSVDHHISDLQWSGPTTEYL